MSIESFISSKCVQTAVYWGNPHSDGFDNIFDDPVEINCRWEDKKQLLQDVDGNTIVSKAVVYTDQDLDEEGWLWLGTLDDLTTAQEADPKLVDDAGMIKKFEKSPMLGSTTEFYRKAYLTSSGT